MKKEKPDVELSFKAVKEDDKFMEKFGIPKHEVEYCYSTLKQAEKIKSDKKKMAAIKDYAGEEMEVAEDMIESLDDLDAKIEKKFGSNRGKEFYDEEKNNSDSNRSDYVDED